MALDTYLIFLAATIIVILAPGAAAITAATQGASNGRIRACAGVFGIALANAIYFALSAAGLASLLTASNLVFSIIKWAGVVYLFWLGSQALFSRTGPISAKRGQGQSPLRSLFLKGFVIEFANPKALLYFAAILPQFIDPTRPLAPQFLIMGATIFVIDVSVYAGYGCLGDYLTRGGLKAWAVTLINKTAGGALLFVGVRMASVTAR